MALRDLPTVLNCICSETMLDLSLSQRIMAMAHAEGPGAGGAVQSAVLMCTPRAAAMQAVVRRSGEWRRQGLGP